MLALSPPLFYAWPLEDLHTQNLENDISPNSYHSLLQFPEYDQNRHDVVPTTSIPSGGGVDHHDMKDIPLKPVARKLNHSASERDWLLDDVLSQNLENDISANSYHSIIQYPENGQVRRDFIPTTSISSGGAVNHDDIKAIPLKQVARKLNHNASERDRRKKVNDLYALLRSLLPMSSDQKKKVSIPSTVSCALKYIPELQKEVETLIRKKEKLSLSSSPTSIRVQEHIDIRNHGAKDAMIQTIQSVAPSVIILNENEAVIQLISSSDHMNNNEIRFLSKAMEYLEEDGFVLLNATTFDGNGNKRFLNTLHVQMQGDDIIEAEQLTKKLFALYQQSHQL